MRWYKIVCESDTWDATGDPNALNIVLDIPVAPMDAPGGNAFVRIYGIPLQTLLRANQFNNKTIQVYGGMQTGLPLANPNQAGLLAQGKVFPALGNWVDTEMTLDFYFPIPVGAPTVAGAANVIHNWKQGTQLSDSIKQTLSTAFPQFKLNINISPNLVLNYTDVGFYQTLTQYAEYILSISQSIMGTNNYKGVKIDVRGNTINVDDGTQEPPAGVINFQDLIGQPVWTGVNTVQFKTVLRADIHIGDTVTMPKALAILTAAAGPQLSGSQASNMIQGNFKILRMRHTGDFRQPSWAAWCTTFDAVSDSGSS